MNELSLQAARAAIYQDLDDPTSFTIRVTAGVGGDPVDLSGRAWSDPDGLMDPIDTTNAAAGELGVSCAAQPEDNHDFRIVADAGTADAVTYLKGVLVVGSTRHVATSGTLTLALEDQSITIAAVVPDHDHSGAYARAWNSGFAGGYVEAPWSSLGTFAPNDGDLRLCPILLGYPSLSIDALVMDISTAGSTGAVTRLGLYEIDGSTATLLEDAGTVAAETTGRKEILLSQAYPIEKAVYGVGIVTQGAPTTVPVYTSARGPNLLVPPTSITGVFSVAAFGWNGGSAVTGALPASESLSTNLVQTPAAAVRLA